MAVNTGSRLVLEKAGLRYARTVHLDWPDPLDGNEHGDVEYQLPRADWAAAHETAPAGSGPRRWLRQRSVIFAALRRPSIPNPA